MTAIILILTIQSQRNDKRAYAAGQLMKYMCGDDSYSISRLGEAQQVEPITPEMLYAHYQKVLQESPVEIFYVGAMLPETVDTVNSSQAIAIPPHDLSYIVAQNSKYGNCYF